MKIQRATHFKKYLFKIEERNIEMSTFALKTNTEKIGVCIVTEPD